jgi:hypothetical protein
MKICLKCHNPFKIWATINGERKNLSSRIYCLACSPFGQHNTRKILPRQESGKHQCQTCQRILDINKENFYFRPDTNRNITHYSECKTCFNGRCSDTQRTKKIWAVNLKGGKCIKCGYHKYIEALEFHHRNPVEKEFNLNRLRGRTEASVIAELEKCDLLCANCHRETHADLVRPVGIEPT